MGHQLTALIATESILDKFAAKHRLHRPIGLEQQLFILPLLDDHIDLILPTLGTRIDGFHFLSEALMHEIALASAGGEIAYVETEYFGGLGEQGAVLFENGYPTFGPVVSDVGPINDVLKRLGVKKSGDGYDEFDAVGLQRHRHTEDWLDR